MKYAELNLDELNQDLWGRWSELRFEQRALSRNSARRDDYAVVSEWVDRLTSAINKVQTDRRRGWNSGQTITDTTPVPLGELLDVIERGMA